MNVNIKAFDNITDVNLNNYIDSLNTSESIFMIVYKDVSKKELQESVCCLNINMQSLAQSIVSLIKQHPEIAIYINTLSQLEYIKEMKKQYSDENKKISIGSV